MRDTFKDKLTMGDRQTKKQGERERERKKEKNRNLKIGKDREGKIRNIMY